MYDKTSLPKCDEFQTLNQLHTHEEKKKESKNDQYEELEDMRTLIKVKDMQIENLNQANEVLRNQIENNNKILMEKDDMISHLTRETGNTSSDAWAEKNAQINNEIQTIINKHSNEVHIFQKKEKYMQQQIEHLNNQVKHLTTMIETHNVAALPDELIPGVFEEHEQQDSTKENYEGKNIQVYADSFFKYVDSDLFFGKENKVEITYTFFLEDIIDRLDNMDKDNIHTTHVILRCGFNNVKKEKHSRDI